MMDTNRMILLVEDDDFDAELAVRAFQEAKVGRGFYRFVTYVTHQRGR
jgi:hypothetical protein